MIIMLFRLRLFVVFLINTRTVIIVIRVNTGKFVQAMKLLLVIRAFATGLGTFGLTIFDYYAAFDAPKNIQLTRLRLTRFGSFDGFSNVIRTRIIDIDVSHLINDVIVAL